MTGNRKGVFHAVCVNALLVLHTSHESRILFPAFMKAIKTLKSKAVHLPKQTQVGFMLIYAIHTA